MIDYIVRSGLCLVILLAVYHLFLEKEKMHRFNRFYLLFSLALGLLAPLVTIEVPSEAVPFIPPLSALSNTVVINQTPFAIQSDDIIDPVISPAPVVKPVPSFDTESLLLFLYCLGAGILLIRFAGNIFRIGSRILKYPKLSMEKASVVLLSEELLPHSFLNYIFINEGDYRNHRVERQLFIHELTHVHQKHSLDILFVEILKILFWFNPVFILYKKAIQLNHEFLADEAVVKSYEVTTYQLLLLEKSISKGTIQLASNLNYSVTKKRLTMMTKTTSLTTTWFIRLAVIPLVAFAFLLFSNMDEQAPAPIKKAVQGKPVSDKAVQNKDAVKKPPVRIITFGTFLPASQTPASQQIIAEYSALAAKYSTDYLKRKPTVTADDKSKMEILFRQMNSEQQHQQKIIFELNEIMPTTLHVPTESLFESWKEASIYGVWIDGQYVKSEELNKYKPSDFSYYFRSSLQFSANTREDVMRQFHITVPYNYRLYLETNARFARDNARIKANKGKSTMYYATITPKSTGYQLMKDETLVY